ncbi:MAG: GntR family transcriptional regulator [Gemmataceae bacterium]
MRISLLNSSKVPIYEQITSQVVFAVAAGDVAAGDLVPSVRDLAQQLLVNPNTVARAFQDLERLGVLEARRGLGMAVTADGPKRCRDRRKAIVRERVKDALREAASAGLTMADVHDMIDAEWPALSGERNDHPRTPR